jgi:hypothetical protein
MGSLKLKSLSRIFGVVIMVGIFAVIASGVSAINELKGSSLFQVGSLSSSRPAIR